MRIYVDVNPAPENSRCFNHENLAAIYCIKVWVLGETIEKPMCNGCLCRHAHVTTYMSLQEGLPIPRGWAHPVGITRRDKESRGGEQK